MRYLKIFLLHFQEAFEYRGRSFIYFLLSFLNPLIVLCFWIAAYKTKGQMLSSLSFSETFSYYIFLIIASAMFISHIEWDVATIEIREGNLVRYILRPFSYFLDHLFSEVGWRVIQGGFGIIAFIILSFFFTSLITITTSPVVVFFAVIIAVLAYILSFLFKMILAFTAFWITDVQGILQLAEVIILLLSGFIMPIVLYPEPLRSFTNLLPFPYSIYYPIIAFQGKLTVIGELSVIGMQILWIGFFSLLYRILWKKGIYTFTGVGQ